MILQKFYDEVTNSLFYGTLPAFQKDPLTDLIVDGRQRKLLDAQLAYILATAYHESERFKYMEEKGLGSKKSYAKSVTLFRKTSASYYGRGYVQLTWLGNYAKMSVALTHEYGEEIDLVNNPELAKNPKISCRVIMVGMINGLFTGARLDRYVNSSRVDFVNARRVVNGVDRADRIAGYAVKFQHALSVAA